MLNLRKWWRKRQKEKKRLKLLALVQKVREEQGDYDRAVPCVRRRRAHAAPKKVDKSHRLRGAGKGRKAHRHI
jgi:hypothetical protein